MDFANSLQTAQDKIDIARDYLSLKKAFIFVSDNDELIQGMPGIVIHEVKTEGLDLDNDITEEAIATRQSLTQHMIPKPADFNISGFVYDIVLEKTSLAQIQEMFVNRLASVDAFLPNKLTGSTLNAYKKAEQVYNTANMYASKVIGGASNVIGFINKLGGNSKEEGTITLNVADALEALTKTPTTLTIKILNKQRNNVVIKHLHIDRETAQTNGKISVSIDFKEIPIVDNGEALSNIALLQRSPVQNLGRVAGKKLTPEETQSTKKSLLYSAIFG